jgi:hypothetical protein
MLGRADGYSTQSFDHEGPWPSVIEHSIGK